jgi:hypothetical protein
MSSNSSSYQRYWYRKNRSWRVRQLREKTKEYRQRNKMILRDHLLHNPCIDCGENDPRMLDFDHVRGEKDKAVSVLARNAVSMAKLHAEIDKCEVRCRNCHAKKTWEENGWQLDLPVDHQMRLPLGGGWETDQ